jgi:hypothetical protein
MKIRFLITFLLVSLAGCSTFEKRAEEKAIIFATLGAEAQDKLRQGIVEISYTPDMVYIALGAPDSKSERTTVEGSDMTWIYSVYYSEYQGTSNVGYRRMVTYNPVTKSYIVYYEPVQVDHYEERVEDRIRVTFRDGKVAVIEKAK